MHVLSMDTMFHLNAFEECEYAIDVQDHVQKGIFGVAQPS